MPARRSRNLAVLAVTGGLLTACSSGATPAADTLPPLSSDASSSAATTAAATPTGPPPQGPADFPVPPEARTHDDAGALAFTYYFIDLLIYQQGIPAGQPIRDLSPTCDNCLRIAQAFDDNGAAGNHYEGAGVSIVSVSAPTYQGDEVVFSFLAETAAGTIVDAGGNVLQSTPAASRRGSGIGLVWSETAASWRVTGFDVG